MPTTIAPLATSPASYGFTRGCMVTAIAPLLEQHLLFWYDKDGGLDDADGRHWIWKSAEELRGWLAQVHRIVVSGPTVARALAALVDSGRWVRAQLGKMRRAFYYRPADECIDQLREMHSSIEQNPAKTSSEMPSPEMRSAFSEPAEPGSASQATSREKPVRRSKASDPTHYQSQGGIPFEAPDWAREHLQNTYALLLPQESQEQPATEEPPTDAVEDCSRLDSQASQVSSQSEAIGVTDAGCAAACDAFNKAVGRGWVWDAVTQMFRHRVLPMRRSLTEMARTLQIEPAALRLLVE